MEVSSKLVLVMVGLPARGKSYISNKVVQYFCWRGKKAELFNVGRYRRTQKAENEQQSSDFFDASNSQAKTKREELASAVLNQLLEFLDDGGDVGVFDATNTTKPRRKMVIETCKNHNPDLNVIFIESICEDEAVLESNFMQKISNSPDYKDMPLEDAKADLRKRIENYEAVYEPIEPNECSYIKLIDLQEKVICNQIRGKMAHQLVSFLMSIHIFGRPIWLTRAGHCNSVPDTNLVKNRLRSLTASPVTPNPVVRSISDPTEVAEPSIPTHPSSAAPLSEAGRLFADRLHKTILAEGPKICDRDDLGVTYCDFKEEDVKVCTSLLERSKETGALFEKSTRIECGALNMLDTGLCAGMTLTEIRESMPDMWDKFEADPFACRLPGGESYKDVVERVEPFVIDLERERTPVLVVSHLSTLQVLYGYFMGSSPKEFSKISIPQHTVIQLNPTQYGWKEQRFDLSQGILTERLF